MSDILRNLNDQHALVLKEFRETVSDVLKPQHDDKFLLRFLKARQFDAIKAEGMLRKNLKWRQLLGIDYILTTYKIPEVVSKYVPTGFLGFDNEGSSVRVLPQGNVDFKGLVTSARKLDIIKSLIYTYEHDLQQMKINNEKTGLNADTFVYILDYESFSPMQVISKSVMDLVFELLRVFEANYPERLKTAYLINVPPLFSTVFYAVKPFLAEETRKKFRFFGKDGWKEELLQKIHADYLPVYLGGLRRDSKGDPKCSEIIVPSGIIPESYYLRNQPRLSKNPDAVEISIDYKAVHLVEIHVAKENSLLEWEVETEDTVLGIGLLYLSKISSPDENKELYPAEEIIPTEKQQCHQISEIGSFLCEKSGFYILQLDNSFGKFLQKTTIFYKVNVTPLGTADNICESTVL